ncbi:uncharacterized protein LOC142590750 [Dermacentor variabilis]|uniref:uncharacterized protein LOC142590750 n=1 Tax=Dermacentor variabilis TaxID=34621 RepID=UPI003F5C6B17
MPTRSESTDGSTSSGRSGSNDTLPAADTWGSWHAAGESHNRCLQFRVNNAHARVSCLLCATPMGSTRWLVPFVGRRLPRELAMRLTHGSQPELVQAALGSSLQAVHDAWLQSLEPTLSRRDELLRAPDQVRLSDPWAGDTWSTLFSGVEWSADQGCWRTGVVGEVWERPLPCSGRNQADDDDDEACWHLEKVPEGNDAAAIGQGGCVSSLCFRISQKI